MAISMLSGNMLASRNWKVRYLAVSTVAMYRGEVGELLAHHFARFAMYPPVVTITGAVVLLSLRFDPF